MLDLLFLPLNPLALTLPRWPGCLICRFPIPATLAPAAALLTLPLSPQLSLLVLARCLGLLILLVLARLLVLVGWSPVWRGRGR